MVLTDPNNPKLGYLELNSRYAQTVFGAVKIAIDRWNSKFPEGKIKFNLSGIQRDNKITLLELQYVLFTYIHKTEFYTFPPQKRLTPNEAASIISNFEPYFGN